MKKKLVCILSVLCLLGLTAGAVKKDKIKAPSLRNEERPYHVRPDLTILNLRCNPSVPAIKKKAAVLCEVQNLGENRSKASTLTLYANKVKIRTININPLRSGEKKKISLEWIPNVSGYVRLTGRVHLKGQSEFNLDNNIQSRPVVVFSQKLAETKVKVKKTVLSPKKYKPGTIVSLRAEVKNFGQKEVTNYPVRIKIGKRISRMIRVPKLGPGKTKEITVYWRAKKGDAHIEVNARPHEPPSSQVKTEKRDSQRRRPEDEYEYRVVTNIRPQPEPTIDFELSHLSIQFVRKKANKNIYSISCQVTNVSDIDFTRVFNTKIEVEGETADASNPSKVFRTQTLHAGETVYYQWTFESYHTSLKAIATADPRKEHHENNRTNNSAEGSYDLEDSHLDRWTSIGPTKIFQTLGYPEDEAVGRLHTLVFDCEEKDIMYTSATRCGIWRSKNGGMDWEPVSDFLPTMGFLGLAADPFQSGVVYAVGLESGGHGGVFKSVDYGDSWKVINYDFKGDTYTRLIASKQERNMFWATNVKGLWKSIDGCESWDQIFQETRPYTTGAPKDIVFDESDYESIFMVVTPHTDHEKQATIAKSIDGGLTWDFIIDNLPETFYSGKIDLYQADPQILYVVFKEPADPINYLHLYKSTDHGDTWEETCAWQYASNEYTGILRIDPENPESVFIGGVGLFYSVDGGQTIETVEQVHADQHDIVFSPENCNEVYVVNDGGIYKSHDRGRNWEGWNHYLPNIEFHEISYSSLNFYCLAGGTQDNGTIITSGNPEWDMFRGGDGATTIINPEDDDEIYTTYQHIDSLRRSQKDDEGNWSSTAAASGLPDVGDFPPRVAINPLNTGELAACANELYWSQNNGDTWDLIYQPPQDEKARRVCYDRDGNLYVAVSSGDIYISKDKDRQNFDKIFDSPFTLSPSDLDVSPEGRVFICYEGSVDEKIWMIEPGDSGYTEKDITANLLPEVNPKAILASPFTYKIVYLGTYNGVFKGVMDEDGEWKWEDYNFGLPLAPVVDLEANERSGYMIVGTTGRGVFRTKIKHSRAVRPRIVVDLYFTEHPILSSESQGRIKRDRDRVVQPLEFTEGSRISCMLKVKNRGSDLAKECIINTVIIPQGWIIERQPFSVQPSPETKTDSPFNEVEFFIIVPSEVQPGTYNLELEIHHQKENNPTDNKITFTVTITDK